jgi:DNA-binding LacI/PurR family transcriptional regulator
MTAAGAPRRRVTLSDVASAAGVDKSVVSRVINHDDRLVIKEETRNRVLEAIADLRYHPNAAARSLRTAKSGTLGLLIPDFGNFIYAEIIRGAEQEATTRGALLLTGTADEDQPGRYVDLLASGRVEGLMLASDRLSAETVAALVATGQPIVSVNQQLPGVPYAVLADDERASRLAVEHLLDLGHRRIAHIRGPMSSNTAGRRLAGYQAALREAGVKVAAGMVVESDYTSAGGRLAMTKLLSRRSRPTAVLVANVAAALGALSAARSVDVRVPEDVSVIAIHDHPLAGDIAPSLTTVRMPLAEMGRAGVRALLGDEAKDGELVMVSDSTELIVRESTASVSR